MSDHALSYLTKEIDGKEIKFGKLTTEDRALILSAEKLKARALLKNQLAEAGLPPEQQYVELRTFDRLPWGAGRFLEYLDNQEAQNAVHLLALKKQYPEPEALTLSKTLTLGLRDSLALACDLCGYKLPDPEKKPDPTPAGETKTPQTTDPTTTSMRGYGT